jgi:hypothetical protein
MGHSKRVRPRTPAQVASDNHADHVARQLGRSLRDLRSGSRRTRASIAAKAGMPRSSYATLEGDGEGGVSLRAMSRAATAAAGELHAYISAASAADQPRDAVHLRHQELVLATAAAGGWTGVPETALDRDAQTSRAVDVLLRRGHEWVIVEVWDWFADVGAALRDWDRRLAVLEAYAIARMPPDHSAEVTVPTIGGIWVVRATARNRRLLAAHRHVFQSRFPGSAKAWLGALTGADVIPAQPTILWVRVDGSALFPSRLG